MKRWGLIVAVLLAGCTGNSNHKVAVTGQIEAESVGIGSRVGGRVAEVLMNEGDRVKQGDILIRLESNEAQAALQAAEAKLAQAEATLAKLEAGARPEEIRQAEAAAARAEEQYRLAVKGFRSQDIKAAADTAEAARAQRDQARAEFARIEGLYKGKAVSQQQYDQARHALEAAEAQHDAAREREDLVAKGNRPEEINMAKAAFEQAAANLDLLRNGTRKEDLDAARAARNAAKADVARAQVGVDEMAIVAPRDDVVESIDLRPGDILKPGPAITLIDPDDLKLYVYVSAAMLGYLRLGQKVTLTTDSYGPEPFEATIAYIAPEGEFTPRNLQTKEERVQQVFGIKLKLNSAGGRLRAGMSATAHLEPAPGPPK